MKNSVIVASINLGPVLDQTRMTHEEVKELLDIMDLNDMEVVPTYHLLTDIDTGEIDTIQNLQSGVIVRESVPGDIPQ
jgi:hypothetical protein